MSLYFRLPRFFSVWQATMIRTVGIVLLGAFTVAGLSAIAYGKDKEDGAARVPEQGEESLIFPTDSWQSAPADFLERRWDTGKLASFEKRWQEVSAAQLSTAMLVIDSGYVVFDSGKTEVPIPCHSVRKSFLNALYGIREREKNLDLDATLADLGMTDDGQLSDQESKATLLQVLQSRSGVYLPAEYETDAMKKLRPVRHSHAPGTFYYYNNWDFNVAGAIFSKVDARGIGTAFQQDIADPLGMQDFDHNTDVSLYRSSPPESKYPAYPFLMSARDRARFGWLYLTGASGATSKSSPLNG